MNNLDELKKWQMENANLEIESIIKQGAPIVTMQIFDILDNYKSNEKINNNIEYTMELYFELLERLNEFPEEEQIKFLQLLKDSDTIDNHTIEKEDSFLISMHRTFSNDFAIDRLIKLSGNEMTKEDFISIHDQILVGTRNERKKGLRENNLKFVGSIQENPNTKFFFENRAIDYFPIRYTEIDKAIERFLSFYNEKKLDSNKYDSLIIPIIYHGLIASLQLFNDGNTRFGRLLQNIEMFRLINNSYNIDLPLPLVYATRQYAGYRDQYRSLITNIVVNNNIESWNKWIMFNLNRIQDGIMYNKNCLDQLEDYNKRRRK